MLKISDPMRPGLVSRRRFLQVGAFGTVGLSLPQMLRASAGTTAKRVKSCILVFANGGPSHLDTFDPKPDAPVEIRGEFNSIATNVPGIRICEHLPRLAKMADRFSLIRTVTHELSAHPAAAYIALTGHQPPGKSFPMPASGSDFPSIGSVLARFRPSDRKLPSYVIAPQLCYDVNYIQPGQYAGLLGDQYAPFVVADDPSKPDFHVNGLTLSEGLSARRLTERMKLAHDMDARLGYLADSLEARNVDSYDEQAFNLLSSAAAKKAFDVSKEPAPVRQRYGMNQYGQSYLLARRLIEAGVRMVMVNDNHGPTNDRWDNHGGTAGPMRQTLPQTDAALSSLLDDLHDRGLLDTTLVVWMGEMGRGPKAPHGDHWPQCYSVFLAGGGIQGGRVHGKSDKHGAYPAESPCTPGDVLATIYHAMGLPPHTTIMDRRGRPLYLYAGEPAATLF